MTDNEKLELLLSGMQGMKSEMQDIKEIHFKGYLFIVLTENLQQLEY